MSLASRRSVELLWQTSARLEGRLSFTRGADCGGQRCEDLSCASAVSKYVETLVGDF